MISPEQIQPGQSETEKLSFLGKLAYRARSVLPSRKNVDVSLEGWAASPDLLQTLTDEDIRLMNSYYGVQPDNWDHDDPEMFIYGFRDNDSHRF